MQEVRNERKSLDKQESSMIYSMQRRLEMNEKVLRVLRLYKQENSMIVDPKVVGKQINEAKKELTTQELLEVFCLVDTALTHPWVWEQIL